MDRRGFLRTGAGAALLAGVAAACSGRGVSEPRAAGVSLIDPRDAPFDHLVVLTLSGRSFDHLLGWLPGADGRTTSLAYVDVDGAAHRPWVVRPGGAGCSPGAVLPHEWTDAAVHLGADDNDGFLLTVPAGDVGPLAFHERASLPVWRRLASGYTTLGNYFAAVNGGAVPNRLYLHAGASDVDVDGATAIQTTIWDRLRDAGLEGRCYAGPDAFVTRFGRRLDGIVSPFGALGDDARAGDLPHVAYVEPPHGDRGSVADDEAAIVAVYAALRESRLWERTVLVVHHDTYGGYFDHVPPPKVIDANANPRPGPHPDYSQLGFRVPCVVVSSYSTGSPVVGGEAFEHTSILRLVTWRWGLEPLTVRDRNARNLAEVFDFSRTRDSIGAIRAGAGDRRDEPGPPPGFACR